MKKKQGERIPNNNLMLAELKKRTDPLSRKLLEYYKKNFGI